MNYETLVGPLPGRANCCILLCAIHVDKQREIEWHVLTSQMKEPDLMDDTSLKVKCVFISTQSSHRFKRIVSGHAYKIMSIYFFFIIHI